MKTIYFVHDQEESPAARKNFLEMAGYRVRLIASGQELFGLLQEESPALILMDILIDGRNGFEICSELNARYMSRPYPVVLCSRIYNSSVFQEKSKDCGASDFLILPMNLEELVGRVNATIAGWSRSVAA